MRRIVLAGIFGLLSTASYAGDCEVPGLGRGGDWVQIQEITRAFRCVIAEIEELKRQQRQIVVLEREVAALKRRVPAEFFNDNGQVTAEPGRLIGKATFRLDARRSGQPVSLVLDHAVIEELCAQKGCHVLLTIRVSGVFSDEVLQKETVGPCGFSYDAVTGDWHLAEGCAAISTSGRDGDGASHTEGGAADTILAAGEACLLTDTEIKSRPGKSPAAFLPDHSKGLFLASVPALRPDVTRPFACVLEVFRTGPF